MSEWSATRVEIKHPMPGPLDVCAEDLPWWLVAVWPWPVLVGNRQLSAKRRESGKVVPAHTRLERFLTSLDLDYRFLSAFFRFLFPQYGTCGRCDSPWTVVPHHTTDYGDGRGCFPLCEYCWQELGEPMARLPYYRSLWEKWELDAMTHDDDPLPQERWQKIADAVMAGE